MTLSNRHYIPLLVLALTITARTTVAQFTEKQTQAYLVATLDDAMASLDEMTNAWKATYVELEGSNIAKELLGYQPPTFTVNIADIASYLYEKTGQKRYATITKDLLVSTNEYRQYFPEDFRTRVEYKDGIPAVNWFRSLPVYVEAFLRTRDSGVYTASDIAAVRDAVESSVDIIFKFPEWGAMNRAMLRAESLMAASIAFPDHPRAKAWEKMARILASDTIGQWEIEDASVYHPIWLHAYVNYLDLTNQQAAFESPMLKFYFDYIVSLLTPAGGVPDFGDGHWKMNLGDYAVLLERAAKEYQSPQMKWAAMRMLDSMGLVDFGGSGMGKAGPALQTPNVGTAQTLMRRSEWYDSNLGPKQPTYLSGDAIDEVVSKKIVMRSGWDDDASYLLLNYKDEGYSSVMQKNYLKLNLAVEEEKMHHGHSDENGISMFMKNGAMLLADGGYRPYAPSGEYGGYRADIFHNRVVVRDARRGLGQPYFEILRNSGAYNDQVRTTKIDFQDFPTFDYSRTRLDDPRTGYQADRVLIRDKKEDFVIVVDALKFNESKFFTAAALWHTREVVETGEGWYRLHIDSLMGQYPNPGDMDLILVMPQVSSQYRDSGVENEERAEQAELAVFQGLSQGYAAGTVQSFVSILIPADRGADAGALASRFKIVKDDADAVTVQVDGDKWFGVKLDLDRDQLADDVRPRYDYDSGRIDYGPYATDADFSYLTTRSGSAKYAATNFVQLDFGGKALFEAPESQYFQVWGRSDVVGRSKWRRWDNFDE